MNLEEDLLDVLCFYIAVGMQICNCLKTFLHKPVFGQPSRSLGEEKGHEHQECGEDDLDDKRTLPRHGAWKHEMEAVIDPARQHVSRDETSILDADHHTSGVRCRDLGLDDRDRHGEETDADTLDSAAGDEGGETRSEDLDEGAEEVYQAAQPDSPLSTDHVA